MKRKRFTEEQIIDVLKEDGGVAKADDICLRHGISSATFYSWRNKYGARDAFEAKRQRELEIGNAKLKRIVADQILDMSSMKELLAKNWRYSLSSAKLRPC
ncbi:MAG: transposase [Pseudomonadota bacterium]